MPLLSEIAQRLGMTVESSAANVKVDGLANLSEAGERDLSFLGDKRFLPQFAASRAAAVIVQKRIELPAGNVRPILWVDDADLAMARVLEMFAPPIPRPPAGIDPAARIAPTAVLGPDVRIDANVHIGERARIGARTVLHANVFIGDDTIVGDDCELFPNVVVRERCTLGARVVIHAGSVIGSDGFGYRWDGTQHAKIPQIGTVQIEDDVEIGSCTCIDRAKFSATRIGRGTKIDNLVQIGHNVVVGPHCIIVGQAGLAGSVTLGTGVILGGQSAIKDHIAMGDGSMLAACSGVMKDVEPKQIVSGLPAIPHRQSLREQAALRKLPEMETTVRKLVDEVERLKKALEAKP